MTTAGTDHETRQAEPAGSSGMEDESRIARIWSARDRSRSLLLVAATVWASAAQAAGGAPLWLTVSAIVLGILICVLGLMVRLTTEPRAWWPRFAVLVAATLLLTVVAGPPWAVTTAWATTAAGWGPVRRARPYIAGLGLSAGLLAFAGGADAGLALVLCGFVTLVGVFALQARRAAELMTELRETKQALARLAVVEERNRIARDLHDLVGHSLSVVAVKTELARRLLPIDAGRTDGELKDIDAIVRRALSEVRQAVTGYRQPALAAELSSAVQAALAAGVHCEISCPDSWELPVAVEGLLAWTVREGITNVLRHSGGSRCWITVTEGAVEIADDGTAVRIDEDRPGNGLTGLSERARALGGSLSAGRREVGGFRLRVEVPR
ncbi:two-component system sensor histidine kinase DesK [Streptosporangium album]|uniref:Two-component system sensor histidine kinase DesK n=1 Tax=Streptosporangium album TaxID=47479 RepID=A0A7W7RW65_9ACTN|nr:sensor histidine kinase [Streptosporangium album]MBB4939351.1 two-component system sensor histidine kinase DesK [Streptosporangium album]